MIFPALIFPSYFQDATWPEFNFAVIENCMYLPKCRRPSTACQRPSTFRKAQFSNSVTYLLHIYVVFHVWSVFDFIYTGKRKEKFTASLYVREGFENRHFQIFELFPRPTCLELRSQIQKGLFSDPSPLCKAS